ncbi:hypothetical protein [Paenibacillus gallinarum]|uniref:DUF4123 domain-containing protein n=1 Tax=Paenibacillus gallinarum TaxID=2762232 RepID=A0ABR8T4B4_9BACL|nr:hypothetical protein [Paenibacillus gallinarum]MBD7970608.1 hypothetical protein [Paenibacillus gallinarum]
MDKPLITLSIEEFGFALASMGAEDVAAGLLKPMYGELSEREWELILQAASHSLLSKGLIVSLEETEIEFVPDLLEMLIHFARSRRMLRGYSLMNDQEKVLTIHAGEEEQRGQYLYHLAVNQRIHLFTWTEPSEWEEELYRFYLSQERLLPAKSTKLRLSESRWNALTAISPDTNVSTLLSGWAITDPEQQLIRAWGSAFIKSGKNLDNLSILHYGDEEMPTPEQMLLLLNVEEHFYSVHNIQPDPTSEPVIEIECSTEHSIRKQLRDMIDKFATPSFQR